MSESRTVTIPELYGSMVFSDRVMRQRLPKAVYKTVREAVRKNQSLDLMTANTVAAVMKEWAVELGATHFTHWFQPMTGYTAEKHDSFISPGSDGQILMDFSGKELVRGEPDASSFPSGGLRATFEARGYTAWDPSSPAFVKDRTLYIPTAFCSYGGQALDHKTPLLRSMEAIGDAALRVLRILGRDDVSRVDTTMGAEQEYFLIDKSLFKKRKDLLFCGRTLFGAPAPKGQEMDDHYFGVLKPRVSAFMHDLDEELWKLGVPAKTKHNEVAPGQFELAPVFETVNIAADHNQLTMEMMKKVADRHGFCCLLHEKPFDAINGSGKHNNWSLTTDTGENLLDPGRTPSDNLQFLIFLIAVIAAVDEYADLLRVSVATAGNDHRLGGHEAPPAIVSIFVGDELERVLNALAHDEHLAASGKTVMETGAHVLPAFTRDNTDRNRTSPFAFTGNKFEFRMPGSALSVSDPNITLNTAVAEILCRIADKLEGTAKEGLEERIHEVLKELLSEHKRILFNGNGYTEEWMEEAARRGLPNLKSLPDAMPSFISEKSIALYTGHGVYTEEEIQARYAIRLESYVKSIHIEALTLADMMQKDLLPAIFAYESDLAKEAAGKKSVSALLSVESETKLLEALSEAADQLSEGIGKLSGDIKKADQLAHPLAARFYHDVILDDMEKLREIADPAEALIPGRYLPYPTYEEMLFSQG